MLLPLSLFTLNLSLRLKGQLRTLLTGTVNTYNATRYGADLSTDPSVLVNEIQNLVPFRRPREIFAYARRNGLPEKEYLDELRRLARRIVPLWTRAIISLGIVSPAIIVLGLLLCLSDVQTAVNAIPYLAVIWPLNSR